MESYTREDIHYLNSIKKFLGVTNIHLKIKNIYIILRNKGSHSFQLLKENNNHLSFNQSCEFLQMSLAIYSHSEHINMHGERKIKKKFYFKNYFYF